jgi:hypothetical protein
MPAVVYFLSACWSTTLETETSTEVAQAVPISAYVYRRISVAFYSFVAAAAYALDLLR